ncbi:MAG: hypothetical protein K2L28_06530, partial [Muribaculaceae bacterium]|nr:hypothetical protein [Muribaculaceae bacterium]
MKQLVAKTINVKLPVSPIYAQKTPVINTPPDKADYKIAATPVGRAGDVTRSDNRRVDQNNNSSGSAIFAPVAACFLDKVVTLMSERTKRPVVAGISGMVFTCSPDNSSYFAQFRIVFPITFSRSDYSEALKNYYKVVDSQNILSIAYYQGSCCRKVRRLENGCASELYFLSEEQGEKSGWLLEFNTTDKTVSLSQWVLTDDGKHYKSSDNTYYDLKDYSSVYRVFKKALECGIFEII